MPDFFQIRQLHRLIGSNRSARKNICNLPLPSLMSLNGKLKVALADFYGGSVINIYIGRKLTFCKRILRDKGLQEKNLCLSETHLTGSFTLASSKLLLASVR